MKHLKIAVMALFTLVAVSNISAQDENNPWVVGFGVNVVDFSENPPGTESWNFLPSISRFSAEKYLKKGFSLQLAGTLNKITNFSSEDDVDFLYYSIGANVKYDLNNLVGETSQWFDPYVYLGGDYVSADSNAEGMFNAGVGFNTWFSDNLGLNFQLGKKKGFANNVNSHYQSSLSLVVKFGGTDTDGDGVYDKKDACPEVAGLVEFNGCPDADGDGVKDSDDACPNIAGLAAMNGCPDADGDEIADKDDMCPNEKGSSANRGCPDSDGDSVVNKDDKCPNVAGSAANGGCPWPDTDGDGVLDKDDNCANEAGPASNNGCPFIITEVAVKTINMEAKSVLFDSGMASFAIKVSYHLDAIVATMNEFPKATFAIIGHTDTTGGTKMNDKLSQQRANAAMTYLVEKGVDALRLTAKGDGSANAIDSNKTRAGRANNRRIEITVTNN